MTRNIIKDIAFSVLSTLSIYISKEFALKSKDTDVIVYYRGEAVQTIHFGDYFNYQDWMGSIHMLINTIQDTIIEFTSRHWPECSEPATSLNVVEKEGFLFLDFGNKNLEPLGISYSGADI